MPDSKIEIKKPPSDPVDFARYSQRPQNTPRTPEVQADDVAMRVKPSVPLKMNKVIGTDKPKKKKFKPANTANTTDPSYLKPLSPPKGVAVAKGDTPYLNRLLQLFSKDIQHPDEIALEKLRVPSMAAFGLG